MTSYDDVANNLVQFKERVIDLEDKFNKVERFITKKELQWHSNITEIKRILRNSRNMLESIKKVEQQRKKDFINLIKDFKMTATRDEYRKLETKINHWDIEKFISRDEFERLLNL